MSYDLKDNGRGALSGMEGLYTPAVPPAGTPTGQDSVQYVRRKSTRATTQGRMYRLETGTDSNSSSRAYPG